MVTGEVLRVRCDNWRCLYCGPRKVDMWRQLVKVAEPTLFVTLTKVRWTLKEAVRVYTTVLEYQRRGSKGRGSDHFGAPPAYPIECFSVLEGHSDFENVGSDIIRNFQGAIIGRADRGLIITTGTFTRDAKAEATRDGAPPIALMDGEQLLDKLKELRLGVAVKMIEQVSVVSEFFKEI